MAGEEGLVFEWPNAPITNSYHYYHHSLQTPTHDMKTWSELLFKMITEGKLLKNNIQDDCRRQQLRQIKKFLASTLGVDKKTIFADTATEKTLSPQLKVFAVIKHTTKP
jgi:predicted metallo-beta-lactamase superfamily hydrolase